MNKKDREKLALQTLKNMRILREPGVYDKLDTFQRGQLQTMMQALVLHEDYCVRKLGMKPSDPMKAGE